MQDLTPEQQKQLIVDLETLYYHRILSDGLKGALEAAQIMLDWMTEEKNMPLLPDEKVTWQWLTQFVSRHRKAS